jgi:hypothetical protein
MPKECRKALALLPFFGGSGPSRRPDLSSITDINIV